MQPPRVSRKHGAGRRTGRDSRKQCRRTTGRSFSEDATGRLTITPAGGQRIRRDRRSECPCARRRRRHHCRRHVLSCYDFQSLPRDLVRSLPSIRTRAARRPRSFGGRHRSNPSTWVRSLNLRAGSGHLAENRPLVRTELLHSTATDFGASVREPAMAKPWGAGGRMRSSRHFPC